MHATTQLLRDLVVIPSVNPMGRPLQGPELFEHRVTDFLEKYFRALGVRYERQPTQPLRDNIVAYFEPPGATRTFVFEAHQDTVPTDNMTIDPFAARIESGRLYGRGACDIKGGMAAMLVAFARLVRERPSGAARVVMACAVDEEFTFLGVHRLAQDDLSGGRGHPVEAVVAEPTSLDIVNTHKGAVRWHLTTHGQSCHSSRPELGVNAIYLMAQVLPHVAAYAELLRTTRIDPLLGPATLSVGRIDGGTSVNTVADRCQIEIDRRLVPGESGEAAVADFADYLRGLVPGNVRYECSEPWLSSPALSPELSADVTARLGRAIDAVRGSHRVLGVPYGTDASKLALAGIPSVVFGPGDIARAHTADEWVPLDEVEQASEILYRLAVGG